MSQGILGKPYSDGQVIIKQGEIGNCMFAIQSGRVEVIKETDHGEAWMAELHEGDIFGEMAIFEHEVRSATVRAVGQALVMTVDKKTFLSRVQADPSIAFNLVRMMSNRVRRLSLEIAELKIAHGEDAERHSTYGTL